MSMCICGGATLKCSFGTAPSVFNVLPKNNVDTLHPIANIMDNKPMVNIPSFGLCAAATNPLVAAATGSSLGTLTPMPCIPVITGPWISGNDAVLIENYQALNNKSKLICMYGGVIEIIDSGPYSIEKP